MLLRQCCRFLDETVDPESSRRWCAARSIDAVISIACFVRPGLRPRPAHQQETRMPPSQFAEPLKPLRRGGVCPKRRPILAIHVGPLHTSFCIYVARRFENYRTGLRICRMIVKDSAEVRVRFFPIRCSVIFQRLRSCGCNGKCCLGSAHTGGQVRNCSTPTTYRPCIYTRVRLVIVRRKRVWNAIGGGNVVRHLVYDGAKSMIEWKKIWLFVARLLVR